MYIDAVRNEFKGHIWVFRNVATHLKKKSLYSMCGITTLTEMIHMMRQSYCKTSGIRFYPCTISAFAHICSKVHPTKISILHPLYCSYQTEKQYSCLTLIKQAKFILVLRMFSCLLVNLESQPDFALNLLMCATRWGQKPRRNFGSGFVRPYFSWQLIISSTVLKMKTVDYNPSEDR